VGNDLYRAVVIRDINTVFLQTSFRLLKSGLKLVFGFTGLHWNLNFKPS